MKQIKKELDDIKHEVEEIEQEGFATEIIKGLKEQCKRKDIIIILLIVCWFVTGCYLVYLLNDIGITETTTEEYTQSIDDVGSIDNTNINNGGVISGED